MAEGSGLHSADLREPPGPHDDKQPGTLNGSELTFVCVLLSLCAGFIHAGVIDEHFDEAILFGAFFTALALFQIGWGATLIRVQTKRLVTAALVVNAVTVAIWLCSSTIGLPVGPQPWTRESVGYASLFATAMEIGLLYVLWKVLRGDRHLGLLQWQAVRNVTRVLILPAVMITVAGIVEGGAH